MFDLLMSLPLFRGVTHARLAEVVGQAKFHFLKYPKGETILRQDDPCTHMTFVISGQVRSTAANRNGRFAIGQTLEAPALIAPDFLFGPSTAFPATVVALDSVSILQITKKDFIKILYSDEIFLFNYLNTLSVNAQKSQVGILSLTDGTLDERIAFWVIALTQPEAKDIRLSCKARDLCSIFGVQRTHFDAIAAVMQEKGLLTYTPREIIIHNRRQLAALLEHSYE